MSHPPPFWLSRDEVRSLDRRAIDGFGVPGLILMENAGRGCADLIAGLNPDLSAPSACEKGPTRERKPVAIVCGPGNNGGDGFVIARHLDNRGWPVDVHVIAKNNREPTDADVNFDILFAAGIPYTQYHPGHFGGPQERFLAPRLARAGWVVDALFGTGLTRPLTPPYSTVVEAINAAGVPVLAVDLPSGLDCDTGDPLGPTVRATHTATFVAWKKGFLNPASRAWTGDIHVIDIGAPRKLVDEYRELRGG